MQSVHERKKSAIVLCMIQYYVDETVKYLILNKGILKKTNICEFFVAAVCACSCILNT